MPRPARSTSEANSSAVLTPHTTPTCSFSAPLLQLSPLILRSPFSDGMRFNAPDLVMPGGMAGRRTWEEPHANTDPAAAAALGRATSGARAGDPHAARLSVRDTSARRLITTPGAGTRRRKVFSLLQQPREHGKSRPAPMTKYG